MDQLALNFDSLPQNAVPVYAPQASHDERFAAFHAANPHVYLAIVSLARELRRQGWKKAGMKQIFEQLRWKFALATRGSQWRLNNNHTAYYARLVMEREPDLAGFFETREREQ